MTTVNFKVPMLDAEGKDTSTTLSKLLSDLMLGSTINEEPMKFFDWALELRQSGVLMLDDSDKERVVNFIKASGNLTVLGKGRLLKAFLEAPEGSTASKK